MSAEDHAVLRVLEERLAMPVDESREALDALLAPEFQEFGSSGHLLDRATVLEALVAERRPRLVFEDFKARGVAPGVVLVTYRSRSEAGAGWKPPALRSSLWCQRDSQWQLVFHQGTRLPQEEG